QAKKEHRRWVARKVKTGWRHGAIRNDEKKTHPCIVSWDRLPTDERAKDRVLISRLPEIVTWAGLTIARCEMFDPLRIGVTGHRILAETDLVAEGVEKALDRIERTYPGRPLVAVSALAEGADRLIAEAILRRSGARLQAILPLPRGKYTQDFTSPESTVAFRHLLGLADEITELAETGARTEAYAAANDGILGQTDVLLAVWDGGESRGDGGTTDVVTEARARSLPIAWVHAGNSDPKTGQAVSLGRDQGRVTFRDL
ncbi:MAG: RyR domain-containing protein, partial [Demequinaceae bacterium]|nr:RyR domain-containing protein [Demequinaceae bacterium]